MGKESLVEELADAQSHIIDSLGEIDAMCVSKLLRDPSATSDVL